MNINTHVKCYNKYRTVLKHIKKLLPEAITTSNKPLVRPAKYMSLYHLKRMLKVDNNKRQPTMVHNRFKNFHLQDKTSAEDRKKRIDKDYGEYVESFREVYEENPSYYESPEAFRRHMPMTKENFVWMKGGEEVWGPVYGIGEEVEEDNEELVAHYMRTLDGLVAAPPVVKFNNVDRD